MTKDGGPAFPEMSFLKFGDRAAGEVVSGMSLRDWFAGQAMMAEVPSDYPSPKEFAEAMYQIADAMLVQREKSE